MSHFGRLSRLVWVTEMHEKEGGAHGPCPVAATQPRASSPGWPASYTKRRFGQMVEPTAAASHHAGVLVAMGSLETAVENGWKKLDPTLRWLAIQATGTRIGCSWCVDYGYYEGMHQGIDPAKVRAARKWRDSDLFDERERVVLEYAEAATSRPAEVSEELAARLQAHLSDAEIVELAAWVALENFRSRFNAGLGLRSQGFSDKCEIPMRRRHTRKPLPDLEADAAAGHRLRVRIARQGDPREVRPGEHRGRLAGARGAVDGDEPVEHLRHPTSKLTTAYILKTLRTGIHKAFLSTSWNCASQPIKKEPAVCNADQYLYQIKGSTPTLVATAYHLGANIG